MKSIFLIVLTAGVIIAAVCVASAVFAEDRVDASRDWPGVKVVIYPSGTTGFFDPDTGILYLYDRDLEQCFSIRQLVKLGQPLRKIK